MKSVLALHRRWLLVLALGATSSLALSTPGSSATKMKPTRLVVPAGATGLYWTYSMPLGTGAKLATMKITNAATIKRVRAMVNNIGVSTYPKNQICPLNYMEPFTVRFSTSSAHASFFRIDFELAGCPSATVYLGGKRQTPTLGGFNLPRLYNAIQKVIAPNGQPLAGAG